MTTWGSGNTVSMGENVRTGGDLGSVDTDDLGLPQVEAVSGDRLKFFPRAWPPDQLPPPNASLLSIASNKGLLAAAGPDTLVIVRTEQLHGQYIPRRRKKHEFQDIQEDEPKIKPLIPEASIDVPRVSHVAFSADESCLIIVAEQGGGLAVYDTNSLTTGAKPAFQLGTNGTSVRHLLPNPSSTPDLAHFIGIVLNNGQLLLADLKERKIIATTNGSPVFHENVYCAAWSKLGKQIIAGLEDGSAVQIDRSGVIKDRIPQPPQLAQLRSDMYESATALPITSISWLSTHEFLIIYSPVNPPPGEDMPPIDDSSYFFALREPKQGWTFRKFEVDPCAAFVQHRARPAGHFVSRLTEWPPNLKDLLILSSSASVDIGILSNLTSPDELATTTITDDSRRPTLPMNAADEDTTPVGVAIDLSARALAPKPIPSQVDIIEEAPGPVPALCVLNTEGVFSMWWIIYNGSIRQNMPYPGITHKSGPYKSYSSFLQQNSSAVLSAPNAAPGLSTNNYPTAQKLANEPKLSAPSSLFGSAGGSFSGTGATSQSPNSTFGKPAFGSSTAPAFGGTPSLGQTKSPWGASTGTPTATGNAAFGKPSFGSATPIGGGGGGSMFGQTGGMGTNKSSVWGASPAPATISSQAQTSSPSLGTTPAKSPFAAFGSSNATASPFAAFSNKNASSASPFAAAGQKAPSSPFALSGQQTQLSPFATAGKQPSTLSKETSMGSTATLGSTGSSFSFGQGSAFQGSALGTPSAKDFGSFVSKPTLSKEATMEDDASGQKTEQSGGLLGFGASGFKLGSLFKGDGTAKDDLPKPKDAGNSLFGTNFGSALGSVQEKKSEPSSVPVKKEPDAEKQPSLTSIPAFQPVQQAKAQVPEVKEKEIIPEPAPLPPAWSASKPTPQGIPEDAPLPPFPSGKTKKETESEPPLAGSPPVDLGNEKFSNAGDSDVNGPAEEDWESDEEDDEDGEEGEDSAEDQEDQDEGEEEEEEEADEELPYQAHDLRTINAFKTHLQPPRPKPFNFQTQSTTPPSSAKWSYTPAGHPPNLRGGPAFPPPAAESLRSPSPARGGFRSVTSPVGKVSAGPLPAQIKQSVVPPAPAVQRQGPPSKSSEPDAGQLEDEADARVKAILSAPIEPNKQLPTFYTHQDYAGSVDKAGIGGQIEKVYRDVNSMIDVLGLNARSLASFVEGQIKLLNPGQRSRDDLENDEAWTLHEIGHLGTIVTQLDEQLESGRLENVRETIQELKDDEKEVLKIKTKTTEIRKLVAARTDPSHLAFRETAPLSAETLAQQAELRQGVQRVQKLLSEVEQKMTVLRANLASLATATDDTSAGTRTKVPTVEAVTRTIQKMTAMVQERSGDIDVLESQIRQLPHGFSALSLADGDDEDELVSRFGQHRLLASSTGSPSRQTPPPRRRPRMAANGDPLGLSGMFGVSAATPDASARRSRAVFSPEASVLARSTGSLSGSARKKMIDVTAEEVGEYNAKVERRRAILDALKGRLEHRGARIVKVE